MQGGIRRAGLAAAGAACLAALVAAVVSAGASADSGRSTLTGSQPAWESAAAQTGTVPASTRVTARVWLAPRNADQLAALATAVSDSSSAQYQQYLSASQYATQFAPTAATVQQVESWLTGAGLGIVSVGAGNRYVAVSGTAAAAQAAFGTTLATYAVNGGQAQAPTTDLSVPASLGTAVSAVTGLSTVGQVATPQDLGAPAAYVNSPTCSGYYGQKLATDQPQFKGQTLPYAVCGYTPSQLRGVYGVTSSKSTGKGQTVAIVDAFDASTLEQDADTYSSAHGDSPFAHGQFTDHSVAEDASKAADCGGNGWYGEQALDVEAVHGMAPQANVAYYGAASCYDDDLMAQLSQIVSDDTASIVSNSWGSPTFVKVNGQFFWAFDPTEIATYESIFQAGAVEGIGFYFSSGDDGDEQLTYGYKHPDYPTGDPWVTSVGGTSLAIGADNGRLFETGWGTAKWVYNPAGASWQPVAQFLYGAGGGLSKVFDEPSYQQGVVPNGIKGRAVPDIAMDADPTTGMLVGETQSFDLPSRFGPAGVHYGEYRIGGTSLACPLLAGIQADLQSRTGRRIGFANPAIYATARTAPSEFYDVTPQGDVGNIRSDYVNGENADGGLTQSVRTFDEDSSLQTAAGWDQVTGVGSVTPSYLTSGLQR